MAHSPSLAQFRDAAAHGNLIPVYRELLADGDTPVSAYAKLGRRRALVPARVGRRRREVGRLQLHRRRRARGRHARAAAATRSIRFDVEGGGAPTRHEGALPDGDPTALLASLLASFRPVPSPALPRFFGGAVGWLGYDVVRAFERLPARAPDELELPEACFVITDTLVIFDNLRQTVKVVANARRRRARRRRARLRAACARIDAIVATLRGPAPALRPLDPPRRRRRATRRCRRTRTRGAYKAAVARAKEYILAGDVFQVVLSQRFEAPRAGADPFDVYRALRVVNPSPYMFHLDFGEAQVTGASPEMLVRVEATAPRSSR